MKHVQNRYYPNPWRKYCDRWWLHWLELNSLYWDIKDFFKRGRTGWANGDTFDLMSYHAGVTLGLLQHFKKVHHGYSGDSPEEYERQLDLAIDAWDAKYRLLTIDGWDYEKESLDEFEAPLLKRWEENKHYFDDIYDSLWN